MIFNLKTLSALGGAALALYTVPAVDAKMLNQRELDRLKAIYSWSPEDRFTYNVLFDSVDPKNPSERLVSSCQTPRNDKFLFTILDSDTGFIPVEAAYLWMPTVSIRVRDRVHEAKFRDDFIRLCNATPGSEGFMSYGHRGADYTGDNP